MIFTYSMTLTDCYVDYVDYIVRYGVLLSILWFASSFKAVQLHTFSYFPNFGIDKISDTNESSCDER